MAADSDFDRLHSVRNLKRGDRPYLETSKQSCPRFGRVLQIGAGPLSLPWFLRKYLDDGKIGVYDSFQARFAVGPDAKAVLDNRFPL